MEGMAATKAQADYELKQLRAERGVGGQESRNSALISSLDKALSILSDQLYQTPTHFLLELIQNADDNSYASEVTPSLRLKLYEEGNQQYLRTDCNEVGFTFEQLNALTLVGESTKKSSTNGQKRYIGEKGIGFKSVFRVANIVHVASGHYEFKLDRNEPIGMILPILSRFPRSHRVPNHTQFLLQLKSEADYGEILSELEGIEPQILIFLQRLEKLYVSTPTTRKVYRCVFKDDDDFKGEMATTSTRDEDDGLGEKTKTKYIVQRYEVRKLPKDSRREGITKSEVVLAFPIIKRGTPKVGRQKVFAFLPIADFGFQFLMHADFLLVASREGLEYKCPWNEALRAGLREAFREAVKRFIEMSADDESGEGLCYTWPKYLPLESNRFPFWSRLHEDILDDLRDERILESRDEDAGLQKPGALRYVPKDFRFYDNTVSEDAVSDGTVSDATVSDDTVSDGTLFNLDSIRRSHLAFSYDGVVRQLALIGVRKLTINDLCQEFDRWTREVGVPGIKVQSPAWHRRVASIFCGQWQLRETLTNLPIVPLRDGFWVKANKERVYFSSEDGDEHVPTGVDISIVDRDASRDKKRRAFFEFLGIETYSPRQVCELILKLHREGSAGLEDRADEDLVRDAAYLFEHRSFSEGDGVPEIYFLVSEDGKVSLEKSRIYIVDPSVKPGLIAKYRETPGNPFRVLDDQYETAICKGDERKTRLFHRWLLGSPDSRFSAVPQLVRNGKLTKEWDFLRDVDVTDLLLAVKYHCEHHSRIPIPSEAVAGLEVRCRGGGTSPLRLLAVPTKELRRECPHLAFADLPSLAPDNWSFLTEFGVLTTCNTTARLRELVAISRLHPRKVAEEAVHTIYQGLMSSSLESDREEIREAFRQRRLVFIAAQSDPKSEPQWISHRACVWTGPAPLKHVTTLKFRYKDCKALFFNFLGVKRAGIRHVMDEFCALSGDDCEDLVQRFEELASLLSKALTKERKLDEREAQKIREAQVYPILKAEDASEADSQVVVLHSLDDGHWYIPDHTALESAFRGKVDLLDLSVKSTRSLKRLFEELGCEDRFLSSAVKAKFEPCGPSIRDKRKEWELKTRLKYIASLAAEGTSESINDVWPIRAWSVPSITVTRRLDKVTVVNDKELITLKTYKEIRHIYFRKGIRKYEELEVNFTLAEYLSKQLDIRVEDANLLSLLLNAPIGELPAIMEKNNRLLPDESDDEGSDSPPPMEYGEEDHVVQWAAGGGSQLSLPIRTRNTHDSYDYDYSAGQQSPTTSSRRDSSPGSVSPSPSETELKNTEIGGLGEDFVYKLFARRIDGWAPKHWTSTLRADAGHASFRGKQKYFADFTYPDRSKRMKKLLREAGVELNPEWSSRTTYHLEVKTTRDRCSKPFYVSQNQVDMMRKFSDDPNNAYILIRVFNIEDESPGIKLFPNTWNLYMDGALNFKSLTRYVVCGGGDSDSDGQRRLRKALGLPEHI